MQIVIDIPEEEYEEIINREDCGLHVLTKAIANGTPLPKGHGRLIDADALYSDGGGEWDGIGITKNTYSERVIKDAPTIIEADKR